MTQTAQDQDIQAIVDALQAHFLTATMVRGYRYPVPAVICADGTRMSVQVGEYLYCSPRSNTGPWTHAEVMWLSEGSAPRNWSNDAGDNLAGYVDIQAIAREIYERSNRLSTVLQIENIG